MKRSAKILANPPRIHAKQPRDASPWAPVCSLFRKHLKDQNLKFTPERAMILDAVLAKDGLFEAEDLIPELQERGHRVSRATVYRTLGHLQDAGICKQVFFDNKQSYYEVTVGRQPSDYLICAETGRVVEFDSEKLRALREEICRAHGFEAISHQFVIFARPSGETVEGGEPKAEE